MASADPLAELRSALQDKDEKRWEQALLLCEQHGFSNEDMNDELESVIKENPIGYLKWIEMVGRPQQAMAVIKTDEAVIEEWERALEFTPILLDGAMNTAWQCFPRHPVQDAWSEDNPKVNVQVVNQNGWAMTMTGLASHAVWNIAKR
mmetsp:Transcript_52850/g.123676  ORF Transcript_52850/g.123676 Transcript_52850/m.123676 type:complete len:148 (+) Transcript_52850:74-517(+)